MLDTLDPTTLGLEVGSGGIIGFIIGFSFKKVAKVIAVLVGLELALLKFLESRGILTVDWQRLTGGMIDASQTAATTAQPPSWAVSIISTLSVGAAFTGGFLLGFKKA